MNQSRESGDAQREATRQRDPGRRLMAFQNTVRKTGHTFDGAGRRFTRKIGGHCKKRCEDQHGQGRFLRFLALAP